MQLCMHAEIDLLNSEYSDKGTNKRIVEEEQSMNFFSFIEN